MFCKQSLEPETARIPWVMARYQLSRSWIYRAAKAGDVILLKIGRSTLVDVASVRRTLFREPG